MRFEMHSILYNCISRKEHTDQEKIQILCFACAVKRVMSDPEVIIIPDLNDNEARTCDECLQYIS